MLFRTIWRYLFVLVLLGCYNKITINWVLINNRYLSSQFWSLGHPRSRHWDFRVCWEPTFWVHRWCLFVVSSPGGRGQTVLCLFHKGTNPILRAAPHDLIISQMPTWKHHHFGDQVFNILTWRLGRHKHLIYHIFIKTKKALWGAPG